MLHCHAQGGMQRKRRRGDSGANGLKGRGQGAQQCRCCLVIFKIYHSISLIFFLSGQSVTIKPLLIRIIRGNFCGWTEKNKKIPSEFLHRLFLSVRRRLTSSTRAEPGEHHIHCGEQMEFKKTLVNWWGDYSFCCSAAVIWEEEAASRIASGWRRQTERPPA